MQRRTVPFFSLAKQTQQIESTILQRLSHILQTQQFIGGTIIDSFEKELASYLGAEFAVSCNSGTDALWLALKALNLQKGSIVLTTPFSFIASASEVAAHEAHPVFIDIDPVTLTLCPKALEQWLTKSTRRKDNKTIHIATGMPVVGMIPVDLFGHCADYQALRDIADAWGLWIVEDACQSIGSKMKESGKMAGVLGDIAAISFYPTKNLGAFGDAGACVTNNPELAQRLVQLRNHGRASHYNYEELGINSRMDCMQAVVLSEKLKHLDTYNRHRRTLAARYHELLHDVAGLTLPAETFSTHVYHQYGVRLASKAMRDSLITYLEEKGIGTRVFYPELLSSIPFLATQPSLTEACSLAQKAVDTIICLPIWPELTLEDIDYVAATIKNFIAMHVAHDNTPASPRETQERNF